MTQFLIVLAILTIAAPHIMIPALLILTLPWLPFLAIWLAWGALDWACDKMQAARHR
jgi:hypothetical protein